jgi:hypothetical protein
MRPATPTILTLQGPPGDNPLGVLAALGTLRTLGRARPDWQPRLAWTAAGGGWRPVLHLAAPADRPAVVAALAGSLTGRDAAPEFVMAAANDPGPGEVPMPTAAFAALAQRAAESARAGDRVWADFCAAYASEAPPTDKGDVRKTDFHFTSGQQGFLGYLRELAKAPPPAPAGRRRGAPTPAPGTGPAHLDTALFEPWAYTDPGPALRWDPADDRRYALRAADPAKDAHAPIRTVRGANRLAVEALPWLPTFPAGGAAATRGFARISRDVYFTWPLWRPPLGPDTVAALLGLADLYRERPSRHDLAARGIAEVYRARRIGGYYRNFAPAVACWGSRRGDPVRPD